MIREGASQERPAFPLLHGVIVLWSVLVAALVALWLVGWRFAAYPLPLSDLHSYFLPKYAYAAQRVAAGALPLWNPLEFGGIPYLAAIESGTLYLPLRIVYGLFETGAAHTVFYFLHLLLGGTLTLLLMRSLGCRLWPSVLAGGWVVHPSWLALTWDHPNLMAASAWVPLLILLVRRALLHPSARVAAALGVTAALQMLTAYPPASVATAYVLLVGCPFWILETRGQRIGRGVVALALAGLVAVLLTAAQTIPTAELLSLTPRRELSSDMHATMMRLASQSARVSRAMFEEQGLRALSLAGTSAQLWREFGPLLLALGVGALALRPRVPVVWAAFAAVVLTALVPLGWLLRLPLYEFVRFGVEWTYLAPFPVYWLAGLGWDAILDRWRLSESRGAALTLAALAVAVAWSFARVPAQWLDRKGIDAPPLPASIAQACDLADPRFRLLWPTGQTRGSLLIEQLRSIGGYEPSLLPARTARVIDLLGIGTGGSPAPGWQRKLVRHRAVTSRMGLKCIVVDRPNQAFVDAGMTPIADAGGRVDGYRDAAALPRARVATDVLRARDETEAFDLVAASTDLTGRSVVLESDASTLPACEASGAAVATIVDDAPEAPRVRVSTPCESYLVLADTWLPGWSATIDGDPVPIEVADYAFRAVRVPAGEHEVEFLYEPSSVRVGRWLSLLGVLLALGSIALPAQRDPVRAGGG